MDALFGRTSIVPTDGEMVFVAMNGEAISKSPGTYLGVKVTAWVYKKWLFLRSEDGENLAMRYALDSTDPYPFDRTEEKT